MPEDAPSRRLSSSSIGASSGVCAWLVEFYLTGIKPDKVETFTLSRLPGMPAMSGYRNSPA
jgi:hypothetical protein